MHRTGERWFEAELYRLKGELLLWQADPDEYQANLFAAGPRRGLPPALSLAEALETTHIHSVAGLTSGRTAVVTTRPFRAPNHTISDVGLIGEGQVPLPGGGVTSAPRHALVG
jgi:hypothetical protein